ncbi:MAG: quinone-dependent dihydroorotate dehydrogenase [Anaerolineales bacterium]
MYELIRPFLFLLDPERAHRITIRLMHGLAGMPFLFRLLRSLYDTEDKPVKAFGLSFSNPVGLGAGYDKDALGFRGLAALGMGHIEIGTVTPRPQTGNPKPRIFRLPSNQALINRMGFPGRGIDFVKRQMEGKKPENLVLGVNIGKNQETPNQEAAKDYLTLLRGFAGLADYIAVNVSSPNTIGLRRLQARDMLEGLLRVMVKERDRLVKHLEKPLPLLVKLAPDLDDRELDDALEASLIAGVEGVIATNTTVERGNLQSPLAGEEGGLSGKPLSERSTEMIRKITYRTAGELPIIGVGGIMSPADALEKLDAGACLVQVYTGLVYQGPGLIKRIIEAC